MQCPFYVHTRRSSRLLGDAGNACASCRPRRAAASAARKSIRRCIAGHAALLALKSRRPVKIVYDRVEDMVATTKRHPSIVRHRTGVTRDGRLTAMDVDGAHGRRRVRHAQRRSVLSRGGDPRGGPVPLRSHAHRTAAR